ncbi:hypothetical protein L209DRAFT_760168 [Thermothelomyces heterothallicus CBS 203.75]
MAEFSGSCSRVHMTSDCQVPGADQERLRSPTELCQERTIPAALPHVGGIIFFSFYFPLLSSFCNSSLLSRSEEGKPLGRKASNSTLTRYHVTTSQTKLISRHVSGGRGKLAGPRVEPPSTLYTLEECTGQDQPARVRYRIDKG